MEKTPDTSDEVAGNTSPFLQDVEQFEQLLGLVQVTPVLNRLDILIKIVIYWINYKFEVLAERGLVESIKQIFFDFFIQNKSLYSEDIYGLVATAQASLYISIYDQWEEFLPWIFSLDKSITSLFLIKFSENSKKLFINKSEQIAGVRELMKSSEIMQTIYEFIISFIDNKNKQGFELLSHICEWCNLELLVSDDIIQRYYRGFSNKESIKPIFKIFQTIITRAEGEEQKIQYFSNLISQESITEYTQQCEDDTFGECASKYLYICFLSIDNTETQEALIEIGRNLVPICGSAKTYVLKILNSFVVQNNELIPEVFEYAWEICLALSSSESLTTINFDSFVNEIEEPLNSIALCYKINKDLTSELLTSIFETIDVINEPQIALAQTMLLCHPQIFTDISELYTQQIVGLAEVGATEIIQSQSHLNLLLGATILAKKKKAVFEPNAATIHSTLFEIITNDELDESILRSFVQPYTRFFEVFSKSIGVESETMGALVMTLDPGLVATGAIGLSTLEDTQPLLEALQLLHSLLESEDPSAAAIALCSFIGHVRIEDPSALAPYLQAVESIATEDDEVMAQYIRAIPSLTLSDYTATAANLSAALPGINGPKSALAMCEMIQTFRTPKKWVPSDDDSGFAFMNEAVASLFAHIQRISESTLAGLEQFNFAILLTYYESAFERVARLKRMPCLEQMPEFGEWIASSLHSFAWDGLVTNSLLRLTKILVKMNGELFDVVVPGITDFLLLPGADPNEKMMQINEKQLVSTLRFFHSLFADALPALVTAFGERVGIDEATAEGLYTIDAERAENAGAVQQLFLLIWRAQNQ